MLESRRWAPETVEPLYERFFGAIGPRQPTLDSEGLNS